MASFPDDVKNSMRRNCCDGEADNTFGECDDPNDPMGPAWGAINEWIFDEDHWQDYYLLAWDHATTNGFDDLIYQVDQDASDEWIANGMSCADTYAKESRCESDWECAWVLVASVTRNNGTVKETYGCRHISNDLSYESESTIE